MPKIIGGRYGLSSKEFTPAHVEAVYDELSKAQPKPRFIVGIKDDVTFLSLDSDDDFSTEGDDVTRAVFFGLGSDGTVSANRSSVKIIGENTPMYSQGYFVYDSRKAGSITTSHVRFSPRPIKGSYLVHKANFVACHKFEFTERIDMLSMALPGATFLLNSPYGPDEVWDHLPCEMQKQIVEKKLKFYVVDAYKVAREAELGVRINTVMQTCFFKLANVIPPEEAIAEIKAQVKKIVRQEGRRRDRGTEQRGHRHGPGRPARGQSPGLGQLEVPHGAARSGACPRLRQGRAGDDDRQPRRRPARQRDARATAPSPRAPRSTRSARSPRKSPSGTTRSASSAGSARWAALTPRSA